MCYNRKTIWGIVDYNKRHAADQRGECMGRNIVLLAVILMLSGCGTGKFRKSEVIFSDTYYLEDTDNMEFVFSDDSTLTVRQKGIYELAESEEGEAVVRICLDDISRELPEDYNFTEYLIREADTHITLTFTTEEFNVDANPMLLFFSGGEDGLLSGEYFDGTYQIGEENASYLYMFEKDGSITMRVNERYYADRQGNMTLSDHAGSTRYLYEAAADTLIIKNMKEEAILNLKKEPESD